MTGIDVLADLLWRIDLAGGGSCLFQADEITNWPAGMLAAFESSRLLRRGPARDNFACDECDDTHVERVLFLDPGPSAGRAFIPCPTNGRVFIDRERLNQWLLEATAVARALAVALDTATTPRQVIPGRCWSLGVASLPAGSQPAYLVRGAGWPDASMTFGQQLPTRLPRTFFLLARDVPSSWQVAGTTHALVETMRFHAGMLTFDFSSLGSIGTAESATPPPYALRRRGKLWDVAFESQTVTLPHYVGLLHIAQLLLQPTRRFPPLELVALAGGSSAEPDAHLAVPEALQVTVGYEAHQVVDDEGRKQVQQRIGALNAKKSGAGLSSEEAEELRELHKYLGAAMGLHRKARRLADPAEQARTRISHALDRALNALGQHLPALAQYLKNSIEQGDRFCYTPHSSIPWEIELHNGRL